MPPRLARASLGQQPSRSTVQKSNRKRKQRGLNAFAIASAENPEKTKISRHRLGETEDEGPRQKRRRVGDEDADESEADDDQTQHRQQQRNHDEEDVISGSDSEGNHWRMGEAGTDDSDVDSDEAFGDSDNDRYEGFSFRGSSGQKAKRKKHMAPSKSQLEVDLNLREDEANDSDDSLGSDAVDLATILDQGGVETESEEEEENSDEATNPHDSSEDDHVSDDNSDDEDDSDDDSARPSADRLAKLHHMIGSLPSGAMDDDSEDENADMRTDAARLITSLQQMGNLDPAFSQSIKKLGQSIDPAKREKATDIVKVPLPKRQQDKIDRGVAYTKAKETLNRWLDTVKHNRRAEHLSFPMKDPEAQEAQGTTRMLAPTDSKARTELEDAIQTIMKESGLQTDNARAEEADILHAEELEASSMPMEEVLARRAELRKARDLMFREEKRAKRIKKIKSKAYRRIHRKEREKEAQKEHDYLNENGLLDSEEEREANDRRRAAERMGARHRESKWAKGVKQAGRATWDEDARAGVEDMARRDDDLRRRVQGEKIRRIDQSDSGSGESSDEDDDDDFQFRNQINGLQDNTSYKGAKSKLASMVFMQRAEAVRRKQNDEALDDLQRDLAGSGEDDESETEQITGRRTFGPSEKPAPVRSTPFSSKQNEFEEGSASEDEAGAAVATVADESGSLKSKQRDASKKSHTQKAALKRPLATKIKMAGTKTVTRPDDDGNSSSGEDAIRPAGVVRKNRPAPQTDGWKTIQLPANSTSLSDNFTKALPTKDDEEPSLMPNVDDLMKDMFGGDDTIEEKFVKEKKKTVAAEDDQVVDNSLPGWGNWAGQGISKSQRKRERQKTKDRFVTKVDGVKPANRKDAQLDRAIISERRIKKNAKYLASTLPHPFESRAQYERSLRLPVGPEWTTKETFQKATKPRVLMKQGIIRPMEKPMV